VNDGSGATNATASTTTVLTITTVPNQRPAITAPATASGSEGVARATTRPNARDAAAGYSVSITQAGKPASLTFTAQAAGPSPRTATIAATPTSALSLRDALPISVNDGSGATNATASTTTVLTITTVPNQRPAITAPATASGSEGVAIATITANATDADAGNSLTITQAGKPASLTFTAQAAGPSPRTATITGTPAAGSAGSYSIVFTVNDGSGATNATASSTTVLTITGGNHPPTLTQPANMNVDEGKTADQIVTGSDQDGDALTFTKASGPLFMTVTTTNNTTGNVHLAPGFSDAGSYTASVQVSDGKGGTDARSFTITVNPVNRGPTANPGGPYNGVVGVPVNFDGTGSTDPDGDALTYAWNFGDGGTAVGSMTSHAYADSGDFAVCLTVADRPAGDPNLLSDTKCTTAHITTELPARVFTVGGNGTIRLASGKPKSCFQIEPVGGE